MEREAHEPTQQAAKQMGQQTAFPIHKQQTEMPKHQQTAFPHN
jgi:hypothetical protein